MSNWTFYAAAGGQGCSTIATAFALSLAPDKTLLVSSDTRATRNILGVAQSDDWEPVEVANLVIYSGSPDAVHIVTDMGRTIGLPNREAPEGKVILVTKACFLALTAARRGMELAHAAPDGYILLREPGRALDAEDVDAVLGVPLLATVDYDPAVARCIDAGLLRSRLPRQLAHLKELLS